MNKIGYKNLNYSIQDTELLMIEERPQVSIEALPKDVIEHIFHHLPELDKIVLSVVSRKFRNIYTAAVQAGRIVIPEEHQSHYNDLNRLARLRKDAVRAIQRDRKCLTRCGGCWDFLPTLLYGEEKPRARNCCAEEHVDCLAKYCTTPCFTIACLTAMFAIVAYSEPTWMICSMSAAPVWTCVSGSSCGCCMINLTTIFGCAALQDKKFEILENIKTARDHQEKIRSILRSLAPDHIKME